MKQAEEMKKGAPAARTGLAGFLAFFLGFAFVLAAAPRPAQADVPVKFTYQGNLRQGGFLVNGSRSMVFRIYNSSSSAAVLWTSPAFNVDVSTGVFRVTLEPTLADWQSGSLWLELEVEGNKMSPREEVTSSPYSINSLLISGKRYTTASSAPTAVAVGDLWMDTVTATLKFWNGTVWVLTSGSGIPGIHAFTHAAGGSDPIVNLGTHTVTGGITFDNAGTIGASNNVPAVTITTNAVITGTLNPNAPLLVGGAGYSVTFSSAVYAGWYHGDGADLTNLNASNIVSGQINGDRIAAGVLVSTHIANNSINRFKLNQSGCANGQLLKWDNSAGNWVCADDNFSGAGAETDPLSIHNQAALQGGAVFNVSSATANEFIVNNKLSVFGPATISVPGNSDFQPAFSVFTPQVPNGAHGGQLQFGLQDLANKTGYIGFVGGAAAGDEYISIGIKNAEDILSIKGDRKVGIGTNDPWEPLEIYKNGGGAGVRFNSGTAEYKIGIPFGEGNLRIVNSGSLSKGQYTVQGITLDPSNNVGIGGSPINTKLSVIGNTSQPYSVAVGTGTSPYQVVVTTSGEVGIGAAAPQATLEVAGHEASGSYVMILRSGAKIAAWLRNK
jgi:hypothetical protein